MLPNPNNRPRQRPRPRPASGNPLLPNGTYSSSVATAPYGGQGQYGAMLPQTQTPNQFLNFPARLPSVNVGGTPPRQWNSFSTYTTTPNQFLNFNRPPQPQVQAAPFMTGQQRAQAQNLGNVPYSQLAANTPYRPPNPGGAPFLTGANLAGSPIAQGFGAGLNQQQNAESVMMRIAQGQDPSTLSAAEQTALESLINGQSTAQTPNPNQPYGGYTNTGGGQYADTASAQYYAAAGTPFEQQITYINGQRMRIGDAIRRGLLDNRTGQRFRQPMRRNRNGRLVPADRGGGESAPAAQAPAQPQGPIPSFGVINMNINTGTG